MKPKHSHRRKRLLAGLLLALGAAQPTFAASSIYVGGGIGTTDFDEDLYEGDGNSLALDVGVRFSPDSDSLGRPSLEIGLLYDGLFSIDASRGDDDDLDLSVTTFYLRHDQQLGDKVWGFAQIGFSWIEIEDTSFSCGFIFNCTTSTNYRNKDSDLSWGVGLNFRSAPEYLLSIGYFDYSQSDIETASWRITLRRESNL